LKNGFAAAQKSFSLLGHLPATMTYDKMLIIMSERRKTLDSPLANHFPAAG
jgi:hypothetical protein